MIKRALSYLNPIDHLGDTNYSFFFPFFTTIISAVLIEVYVYFIAHDPNAVGLAAIFVFIGLIIYFSFRDGIRAGAITSSITIIYYGYIIYSRHYVGQQLSSGVETTIVLATLYYFLSGTIGWLKETIDVLIERETNEKRRLQTIIQQLPVGVIITDNTGKVVQVNKKLESILGMKFPIGFTVGKESLLETQKDGKPIKPTKGPLAVALLTGKSVETEYSVKRKDGKEVYLQVSASAVHNKSGKIIAAASITSDITQQKELERRKDDFVNMASHELKTPLTSMNLYIDSLLKRIQTFKDEKASQTIINIKKQNGRLQKLVNDLLDVSRLQTGKLSYNKEPFRLDGLIKETVDLLQGSINTHKIQFSTQSAVIVNADKFRIYQVITNLLNNAIKYSPNGKIINIKLKKAAGKVIVIVQDFGLGVAKDQQRKIFDRLYQVSDDSKKTYPGFGMGLYISSEIIKRHKGKIWVESTINKGSTFYFTLPLDK